MKKYLTLFFAVLFFALPSTAFAQEAQPVPPTLKSISFKNARLNEELSPNVYDYTLTLDNPSVTPTLNDYEINGSAEIFITTEDDLQSDKLGVAVTLEYESGTVVYNFIYSNAKLFAKNSNNLLKSLECRYGEVYPKINDSDTNYRLYIPSDLQVLKLTAVTKDVSASCDLPSEVSLSLGQEADITATVVASNGEKRLYHFEIKRLKKNTKQVIKEMKKPGFETLVENELFYNKPEFTITVFSVIGGLILLLIFVKIAKRLTLKAEDIDETDFFVTE